MRRVALTRFQVAFSLTHNGRVIHRWPACRDNAAEQRRLAAICGQRFVETAVQLEQRYDEVLLKGWLSPASSATESGNPVQYCFINGRMIRDKLLTHALRQAYSTLQADAAQASYVIYLQLPASELDVNVHPTKHEVRFTQSRLIHDFLVQAVEGALSQDVAAGVDLQTGECLSQDSESASPKYIRPADTSHGNAAPIGSYSHYVKERAPSGQQLKGYHTLLSDAPRPTVAVPHHSQPPRSPDVDTPSARSVDSLFVAPYFLLINQQQQSWCINLLREQSQFWQETLASSGRLVSQPLLLPVAVNLQESETERWNSVQEVAEQVGIEFRFPRANKLVIQQLPSFLRRVAIGERLEQLLTALEFTQTDQVILKLVELAAESIDWPLSIEEVMARRSGFTSCDWCQPLQPNLQTLFS